MRVLLMVGDLGLGGGGERVVTTLALRFSEDGHDVAVLHFGAEVAFSLPDSVRIYHMHNQASGGVRRKLARLLHCLRAAQGFEPDVVAAFGYTCAPYAAVISSVRRCVFVASERNDPASEPSGRVARLLRDAAYRRADHLVCQTRDARAYFKRPARSSVILNPLRPSLPERWTDARRHAVVNYCRLEPQKNLSLMVEAFAEFSKSHASYRLEIHGDGSLNGELLDLASDLGLESRFTIIPFSADVHERVRDAMMFVSSSDHEGLSNSMLEAIAIGIPSIVTDCPVGGSRTVVRDGQNGLLVPVRDRAALVAAMCRVADTPELRDHLSLEGVQLRLSISADAIATRWLQLFARLVSDRNHGAPEEESACLKNGDYDAGDGGVV